jgi:protein-S-isoprenylcysteine O-methyltransferase Ste14
LSGLAGALAVVVCAAGYSSGDVLNRGLFVAGLQLADNRVDAVLAALIFSAAVMLLVEFTRLRLWHGERFFCSDPDLQRGLWLKFLLHSAVHYGVYLCLLGLVVFFFHSAGEYGFARQHPYYRPWFRLLDLIWTAYLWAGLPYVLLTRALKHSADADRMDLASSILKMLAAIFSKRSRQPLFAEHDKKNLRALLVKLFFAPLMTVFFADQFPHLVNNIGYLFSAVPEALAENRYSHRQFNLDFFNLSVALVFSIDVALAWCGYMVSSRWVDNQTQSVEPTLLGWLVCLVCYPPFQMFLGLYYAAPGEREVLRFAGQWLVTLSTAMMLLSYLVYMAATLHFGVRFSNLTHRGIIRTGLYRLVRHPAYAAKNFAWWCVMFPAIVYSGLHTGWQLALAQTLGLLLMTWVYYWRAITEERHLRADPAYCDYCRRVRYRFIPGLL